MGVLADHRIIQCCLPVLSMVWDCLFLCCSSHSPTLLFQMHLLEGQPSASIACSMTQSTQSKQRSGVHKFFFVRHTGQNLMMHAPQAPQLNPKLQSNIFPLVFPCQETLHPSTRVMVCRQVQHRQAHPLGSQPPCTAPKCAPTCPCSQPTKGLPSLSTSLVGQLSLDR